MTKPRTESGKGGKPEKEDMKECSGHMHVLISERTHVPASRDHSGVAKTESCKSNLVLLWHRANLNIYTYGLKIFILLKVAEI